MCGIAGVVDFRSPPSRQLLERMNRVLEHRGPDGEGVHLDGPAGLAHRRLSIIDLASGKQPMASPDGRLAIVFNGEIYNFRSLREVLIEKGHRFRTLSDTEVILEAYAEWGEDCVGRLRGMFAFAIWDARKELLFLARDRVGIKPLYYAWDGSRFLFASEIKAILEDPGVERSLDPLALDDYLTYLYVPGPRSIFRSIRKLRPAHSLTVSRDGLRQSEYWDLSFEPRAAGDERELAEALLDKLRESVSIHLVSDVPIGAFLSGGIDSSAVVGLMAGLMDRPVNTASIGFREESFNELPYARMVAEKFRTNAYEKIVDADAAKILEDLAWHYDEPFADSSMVPTYYVSEVAREKVTVCLSGDGGDENFAGYRRYRFDVLENRIRAHLPGSLRRLVFGALGTIYPKADWLPRVFRARTLFTNLSMPGERAYFNSMSKFSPAMKAALYRDSLKAAVGGHDPFSAMEEHFARTAGWDPLSRIQYVDIKTYLVDDILTKVDRASMAHSLEVRVPLLDHEVMEFAAAVPAALKLRNGCGKRILREALDGLVPREVMDRPKMGFVIPLARWFRTDLKSIFAERIFSPGAFIGDLFEMESIRRWWKQHQTGLRDYSTHLWALLMLECWGSRFRARC